MQPSTAALTPDVLFPRRLAHRALLHALEGLGLPAVAVLRLNPDDVRQTFQVASTGPEVQVRFSHHFQDGRYDGIATVFHDGATAKVVVERVARLVRPSHRRDVQELNLPRPVPGEPEIDVTFDLTDLLEQDGELLRTAPPRPPVPYLRRTAATGSRP